MFKVKITSKIIRLHFREGVQIWSSRENISNKIIILSLQTLTTQQLQQQNQLAILLRQDRMSHHSSVMNIELYSTSFKFHYKAISMSLDALVLSTMIEEVEAMGLRKKLNWISDNLKI